MHTNFIILLGLGSISGRKGIISSRIERGYCTRILTMKEEPLNIQEYGLLFTQLSLYDSEMVKHMRNRMSFFVANVRRACISQGKVAMMIGDMDISWLIIHVHQKKLEKLRDREEYKIMKPQTRSESAQQKTFWNRPKLNKKSVMHHHILVLI